MMRGATPLRIRWLSASHRRCRGDSIGPELADAAVVATGTEAYRRRDNIAVIPAALLGP